MLLTIDIGNTNITIGIFEGEKLLGKFRMTSKLPRTSDEYGLMLREMVRNQNMDPDMVEDVIVASVVPDLSHSFGSAIVKYFNCKPITVSAGIKTGIRVATENPRQTGPDRIVDAVAAYQLYGAPTIVVDFGTATTYDLVEPDGTFGIGVTAPGIRTSARALWSGAAMLPEVELKKPDSILARETISSMQAGLIYGYIGQSEYIIKKLKEESGYTDAKVIATGGLGNIIVNETDVIDFYDPDLTLQGLRLIYEKNKKNK